MTEKRIWRATLEWPDNTLVGWNYDTLFSRGTIPGVNRSFSIETAELGKNAKPGDLNVVEVTTLNSKNDMVRIPAIRLKIGDTTECKLQLAFSNPPVTFYLARGKGPVEIAGKFEYVKRPFAFSNVVELSEDDDEPFLGFPDPD